MFGLTFDKLVIIGVVAAFILGPSRLPAAAATLGRWVRGLRQLAEGAKTRLREEAGEELDDIDWKRLDPRQYDPRRIIRDALSDTAPVRNGEGVPGARPTGEAAEISKASGGVIECSTPGDQAVASSLPATTPER